MLKQAGRAPSKQILRLWILAFGGLRKEVEFRGDRGWQVWRLGWIESWSDMLLQHSSQSALARCEPERLPSCCSLCQECYNGMQIDLTPKHALILKKRRGSRCALG